MIPSKIIRILYWFCFCILFQSTPVISQLDSSNAILSERAGISIITCDPGNQLYSLFGHSAIRVFDPIHSIDEVYNFGTFDFEAPNFGVNFLRGKLLYTLGKSTYEGFLREYLFYQRQVKEQILNLTYEQKISFYGALLDNYKPENRDYPYDFFFDNCTTRIRDMMENLDLVDSRPIEAYEKKPFRTHLHEFLTNHPWTKFGMDLVLGQTTDTLASYRERMFLPEYLFQHYDQAVKAEMTHVKLVRRTDHVLDFDKTNVSIGFVTPSLFFGFLLLIELFLLFGLKAKGSTWLAFWDHIWYLLLFATFMIFAFMWFGTDHSVCRQNWNMLWAYPWMILVLFTKNVKIRKKLHLTCLAISVILIGIWDFIPQYLSPTILIIILISAFKSLRSLGVTLKNRISKPLVTTVVFLSLIGAGQLLSQNKIAGITLVAPPNEFKSDPMIQIKEVNSNWIALVPFGFSRKNEPSVRFGSQRQWWGERIEGIEKSIDYAKNHGIKVMLKPQVWIPGGWVGEMDFDSETDWMLWESSYREYIMSFVQLAARHKVEMICIGTEYRISVIKREKFWRKLIRDIREIYSGKLTYSSNWDSYDEVPFWDQLDYIGISSYFPLSDLSTPPVLYLGFKWNGTIRKLRRFSTKHQKKILFTEYGYLSVDGAAGKTWELESIVKQLSINEQAQSNGYEALFKAFWNEDFWAGGFLWKWFPDGHGHEGYPERDYTPQGKLAEKVLKEWYQKAQ